MEIITATESNILGDSSRLSEYAIVVRQRNDARSLLLLYSNFLAFHVVERKNFEFQTLRVLGLVQPCITTFPHANARTTVLTGQFSLLYFHACLLRRYQVYFRSHPIMKIALLHGSLPHLFLLLKPPVNFREAKNFVRNGNEN